MRPYLSPKTREELMKQGVNLDWWTRAQIGSIYAKDKKLDVFYLSNVKLKN